MTIWMNLHTLPAGQHQYTAWVIVPGLPDGDEFDFTASDRANARQLVAGIRAQLDEMYGPTSQVVGLVDQSTGDVLIDS